MHKIQKENIDKAYAIFLEYISIEKIDNKISEFLENVKNNNPSEKLSANINYMKNNIDKILKADVKKMKEHNDNLQYITKNLETTIAKLQAKTITEAGLSGDSSIARTISKNFEKLYNNFIKNKKYSYKIIEALGIKACPYCNINYTYAAINYDEDDKPKYSIKPHYDHYYPKSIYPYLALSFYNLIPSCPSCNSSLKGNKDYLPVHPYTKSLASMINFRLEVSDIKNLYKQESAFSIAIDANSTEAETHLNLFKLTDRYQYHKDVVRELLIKKKCYSLEYINSIRQFLDENGNNT